MTTMLASLSPDLRAAIIRAYRAWKRTAQQLSLFDDIDDDAEPSS